MCEEVEQK